VSQPTDLVDEHQRLVGERAALRRIAARAARHAAP